MGSPLQAEEHFLQITKMDKLIVDDTYLIPYAVAEIGFLYQATAKPEDAIIWLEAAKYIITSSRNHCPIIMGRFLF